MDVVTLHFLDPNTGSESTRRYEVSKIDEAFNQYHLEFSDDSARPRVFRVEVKHK